jgi:hypothetical protein
MIIHVPFRVTLQGNPSQFSVLAGSGEIPGTDRRKLALVLETLNNGILQCAMALTGGVAPAAEQLVY